MKDLLPTEWKKMIRELAETHATGVPAQEALYQDVLTLVDACCSEMADFIDREGLLKSAHNITAEWTPAELDMAKKKLRSALEEKGAPPERIDEFLAEFYSPNGKA